MDLLCILNAKKKNKKIVIVNINVPRRVLSLSINSGLALYNKSNMWVPLVEQELLTLPEHLSSPPVFSGVRVAQSCRCFVDHCFFFWSLYYLSIFDLQLLNIPLGIFEYFFSLSCSRHQCYPGAI
jgi:hypothetical protein